MPEFAYLGRPRWTGPWINPNTFGALMAVGVVLACGMLLECWRQSPSWSRRLGIAFTLCALPLLSNGLLRSYSRGSWLAAAGGLVFIALALRYRSSRREEAPISSPGQK
jgi:O-antigen ligase